MTLVNTLILSGCMTLSTPPDSTKQTCIEDYKLMFFAQEHIRAKGLRIDTTLLRGIIKDQQDVIELQHGQIKNYISIRVNQDSVIKNCVAAYQEQYKALKKAEKKAETNSTLAKVLGVIAAIATTIAILK